MKRAVVAIVAILAGALTCGPAVAQERRPEELVQLLGSPDFDERELADERLMKLGLEARAALEQGCDLPDREIRYRSRRILAILEEKDFVLRLQAFENGQTVPDGMELPMWAQVRDRFGDELPVRRLFAEMTREERDLLKAAAGKTDDLETVFDRRLAELTLGMNGGQALSLGSAAAFYLACGVEGFQPKPHHISAMNAFWHQQSISQELSGGKNREMLRELTSDFIVRLDGSDAYMGLQWAMQFDLPRGLELARKTLQAKPRQHHVLQYAILTLAKFGSAEDVSHLEPYFSDEEALHEQDKEGRKIETRIGDVAIAVAIHLVERKPEEFGFDEPQHHPLIVFNTTTLGFDDDAARQKTHAAWAAFRKDGTEPTGFEKPAPKPDAPAAEAKTGEDLGEQAPELPEPRVRRTLPKVQK